MKLLICTQIVDEKDSTLGFFHAWIAALAERFESVEVICLQEGNHNLPGNVRVHSLGKEAMSGSRLAKRMHYVSRLVWYTWKLRNRYDTVFVHMNQEYILSAGPLFKLLRKPVYFWRNHYEGSFLTDIAAAFCVHTFSTSNFSYTARYKKNKIMPVGVDMSVLEGLPELTRAPHSVLSIGRVAPSKNIHLLIEALGQLHKEGIGFTASVYGKTAKEDESYLEKLKQQAQELGVEGHAFCGPLPKTETYKAYRTHEISVNASRSGMLDKTMFSGMMHGCLLLTCNKDLSGTIPPECSFEEGDVAGLTDKLRVLLNLPEARATEIRTSLAEFVGNHSLERLADDLARALQG